MISLLPNSQRQKNFSFGWSTLQLEISKARPVKNTINWSTLLTNLKLLIKATMWKYTFTWPLPNSFLRIMHNWCEDQKNRIRTITYSRYWISWIRWINKLDKAYKRNSHLKYWEFQPSRSFSLLSRNISIL